MFKVMVTISSPGIRKILSPIFGQIPSRPRLLSAISSSGKSAVPESTKMRDLDIQTLIILSASF